MIKPASSESVVERGKKIEIVGFFEKYGVLLFLVALIVIFTLYNPMFLSARNIKNILTEVSIYGIIGVGMTYVILTGGIDLAVGSLLAFAAISGAFLMQALGGDFFMGWLVAMLAACAVGTMAGYLHGKVVTRFGVPAFIVTLGGLTVWRGATLIVNDGAPVSGFNEAFRWWGRGDVLGVPVPVLVFLVVALVGYIALRYTRYGRQVYAVGGNPEAARLSGLSVQSVVLSVYVITGFLAGLAGFLLSARLGSAEAVAGTGYELRIIASVVIGGTSLFGGLGGVGGTIVGALLIGVLINGLVIMNVSAYYQQVVIGIIIVLAVGFDTYAKSRGKS
ncbi:MULTISPECIES: ABC transporter permease [Pseudomonas]|uniref:Ribose transport system permease protein n=1 Tax=Pseudomonas syringae pv. spinaceae TaxID=264459 RepID=A0A0N8TAI2_PSESX|nr:MULTISPECIES: ABC transporter permease [Pseudomonas]KPW57346.1 Ribose transport system permease protein [Pseudomonas syringae pv. berberidis]KPZ05265.1 Ribose transport system permease protein [Pseudomonas syringae pv. spinaceae]RMP61932.1 Ribose transport system permease protein [Pseudomonas syringae pv. berberidis]RMQ36504.1 Ribose transport system permease protein [Pseudomonas syringae pv. berberidis]RMT23199.1 Ribose transport system permease protein [Pseudomonas syringae pv. spinaceae]